MLTKTDLNQIRVIVREEVDTVVEEKLEGKLGKFESKFGEKLESTLEAKLKPIRKDIRYLKKTVSLIVKNYDEGDVKLDRRVTRIEQHLGMPPEN